MGTRYCHTRCHCCMLLPPARRATVRAAILHIYAAVPALALTRCIAIVHSGWRQPVHNMVRGDNRVWLRLWRYPVVRERLGWKRVKQNAEITDGQRRETRSVTFFSLRWKTTCRYSVCSDLSSYLCACLAASLSRSNHVDIKFQLSPFL